MYTWYGCMNMGIHPEFWAMLMVKWCFFSPLRYVSQLVHLDGSLGFSCDFCCGYMWLFLVLLCWYVLRLFVLVMRFLLCFVGATPSSWPFPSKKTQHCPIPPRLLRSLESSNFWCICCPRGMWSPITFGHSLNFTAQPGLSRLVQFIGKSMDLY